LSTTREEEFPKQRPWDFTSNPRADEKRTKGPSEREKGGVPAGEGRGGGALGREKKEKKGRS